MKLEQVGYIFAFNAVSVREAHMKLLRGQPSTSKT